MSRCEKCGEGLVCPKCTPIIEHTNAIVVRYKDKAYNGGYPNAIVIAPLYTKESGEYVSTATFMGDNFFDGHHTHYETMSVEEFASFIASCSTHTVMRLFDIKQNRKQCVDDLLNLLRESLGVSNDQAVGTSQG